MLGRMPTSALLERVEAHINRLDRALKDSENLLHSVKHVDRDDWIRQLHERLTSASSPTADMLDHTRALEQPAPAL